MIRGKRTNDRMKEIVMFMPDGSECLPRKGRASIEPYGRLLAMAVDNVVVR